jgi:hypothetical protein
MEFSSEAEPKLQPPPTARPQALARSRNFENTNFNRHYSDYRRCKPDVTDDDFEDAVTQMIAATCAKNGIPNNEGKSFAERLFKLHMGDRGKALHDRAVAVWSTAERLRGVEFCSMMNAIIREDDRILVSQAARICYMMHPLLVTAAGPSSNRLQVDDVRLLPEKSASWYVTHRGGSLPAEHNSFFTEGKSYRAPQFIASSRKEVNAHSFRKDAQQFVPQHGGVHWRFHWARMANHVQYIEPLSQVPGEMEYLLTAYSCFRVLRAPYRMQDPDDGSTYTVLDIEVLHDNKIPGSEQWELAPWC